MGYAFLFLMFIMRLHGPAVEAYKEECLNGISSLIKQNDIGSQIRSYFEKNHDLGVIIADNNSANIKEKRRSSLFHVASPMPCACEARYGLINLGSHYVPRYLPTARCQPFKCWNPLYTCQEKHYLVQVLRKRNPDEENMDATLPDTLNSFWVQEPYNVTVACECASTHNL